MGSPSGFQASFSSASQSCILATTTIIIKEFDSRYRRNDLFDCVECFLVHRCLPNSPAIDPDQEIPHTFNGMPVTWVLRACDAEKKLKIVCGVPLRRGRQSRQQRHFELSFENEHRSEMTRFYLNFVEEEAERIRERSGKMNCCFVFVGLVHVIGSLVIQFVTSASN